MSDFFLGSSNHGIQTVLPASVYAALQAMHDRVAAGEDWDEIHRTTQYPRPIMTFVPDEDAEDFDPFHVPAPGEPPHIMSVVTGTLSYLQVLLAAGEHSLFPTMIGNLVPFSNQWYRQPDTDEGRSDLSYVVSPAHVAKLFGLDRPAASLPADHPSRLLSKH